MSPAVNTEGDNCFSGKAMDDDREIRIGGIKFSEELVQLTFFRPSTADCSFTRLLQLLAEKSVNIPFLCSSSLTKTPEGVFCVDRRDLGMVEQLLRCSSTTSEQVKLIPSVGMLTVFPHRNSFKLLGRLIRFFGDSGYPLHSLGTSISAVAIITDYQLLEEIAEKLQSIFTLPDNHAPFRQGFRVTQIQP